MRKAILFTNIIILIVAIIVCTAIWPIYGFSILGLAVFGLGIYDITQTKHAITRNFPVIGHMRYLLEMIGPEIHQYFIEDDTDGKPIDRNRRTYVYQRAKLERSTHPFGTELNVEADNYKWMKHSIYPSKLQHEQPRVLVGGPECSQPYSSSIFNISAMSYGSLSKNAIMALNLGAKAGDFSHNTGEGAISDYHKHGGDLVWEIGTGYFGCRTEEGEFSPENFKKNAVLPEVKMIEIKISQGAKPGHGGVLPASKNTEEIAKIRGVKPHTEVLSPPGHSAFKDAEGLLKFVKQLRELSGGKPVGFKLCVGRKEEFRDICEQMLITGIQPDFITVDGAEGGTGAAPIDFSNYVGMPWEEALIFVVDTLNGYRLKDHITIITATKIFTAFDIFKALCIGADVCNSARGMMLALGCIQALKCDTNKCPTGVASNDPAFMRGLVVAEKWERVKNYQAETLKEFAELFAAAGCVSLRELDRNLINKRIIDDVKTYEEWYPTIDSGVYFKEKMPA
ncbi:FMN-binding glutamate synthase family protein [Nonlabens antarcticus]|uniref:FMN-binding glutamate synthase family protein n=1 Tax=Nonlabens antarcticus TaxID=392714 RepID=UPI001891CBFF|nr:FMN-binding glutamate synthase family protein [Nonlabens antarcticus]